MINNQDPHGEIKKLNYETGQVGFKDDPNEEIDLNRKTALPSFTPKMLSDNQILESINSLNSKQFDLFNVIHSWAKDDVKYNGNVK